MRVKALFQFFDVRRELAIGCQHFTQSDKGAYNVNAHGYGARGVEHGRGHDRAVFGESVWQKAAATSAFV